MALEALEGGPIACRLFASLDFFFLGNLEGILDDQNGVPRTLVVLEMLFTFNPEPVSLGGMQIPIMYACQRA